MRRGRIVVYYAMNSDIPTMIVAIENKKLAWVLNVCYVRIITIFID